MMLQEIANVKRWLITKEMMTMHMKRDWKQREIRRDKEIAPTENILGIDDNDSRTKGYLLHELGLR